MSIVEEAVQWVDEHRGKIVNFGKKYLEFTPYDEEDLESAAKHAAILAGMKKDPEDLNIFESHFWVYYKSFIREIVPFNSPLTSDEESYDPKSMSRWSQSVSSINCVGIDEVKETMIVYENHHSHAESFLDCISEAVFWSSYEMLTPIERKVLYCRLGFGSQGVLSISETAKTIGIVRNSAFSAFESAMKKISRAVKIGLIELTSFPSHSEMKEMESRFLLNNRLQN